MSEHRSRRIGWKNLLIPSYKSRSDEFMKFFCDIVPSTERLIADYSCALHREILIQGRLYISVNYLCFYANIFGWITKLAIPLRDVSEVLKANTAKFIPNAIQVITNTGEKHIFASFLTRDKSFVLLLRVWHSNRMSRRMSSIDFRNLIHVTYGRNLGMRDEDLVVVSGQSNSHNMNDDSIQEIEQEDGDCAYQEDGRGGMTTPNIPITTGQYDHRNRDSDLTRFNQYSIDTSDYNRNTTTEADYIGFMGSTEDDVSSSQEYLDVEDGSSSLSYKDVMSTFAGSDTTSVGNTNIACDATSCNCENHEGQLIEDSEFNIDIDTLFRLLFTNSKFMRNVRARRGMYDAVISAWEQKEIIEQEDEEREKDGDPENQSVVEIQRTNTDNENLVTETEPSIDGLQASQKRELTYSININHMLAKKVNIQEIQSIRQAEPGVYVLKSRTKNTGVPYSEAFTIDTVYCLTNTGVPGSSRLQVHTAVNFIEEKSSWGWSMVKNSIEKSAMQGVREFVTHLKNAIDRYIARNNSKSNSNSLRSFSSVSTLGS